METLYYKVVKYFFHFHDLVAIFYWCGLSGYTLYFPVSLTPPFFPQHIKDRNCFVVSVPVVCDRQLSRDQAPPYIYFKVTIEKRIV